MFVQLKEGTTHLRFEKFISSSRQLSYVIDPASGILSCKFGDIHAAGTKEFLDTVSLMGDAMSCAQVGRMCMDIQEMRNFGIPVRLTVVRSLKSIFLDKVPYLVLAVVKSRSAFENITMQMAVNSSMPLSRKFVASRMFDTEEDARKWLKEFRKPELGI